MDWSGAITKDHDLTTSKKQNFQTELQVPLVSQFVGQHTHTYNTTNNSAWPLNQARSQNQLRRMKPATKVPDK